MRASQGARVLEILGDGRWHSTVTFLEAGILRPAARVHELRRGGHRIEIRRVRAGAVGEYRLARGQLRVGVDLDASQAAPCSECGVGRGYHTSDCSVSRVSPTSDELASRLDVDDQEPGQLELETDEGW